MLTCERCQSSFEIRRGDRVRRFCSRLCWYKTPRQHSAEAKEKMALSKRGDQNPAKRPEVRAKISESLRKLGPRPRPNYEAPRGPQAHNWRGGVWQRKDGYVIVWIPPDERHKWPEISRQGYVFRSHAAWNEAHPDDPWRPGEVIHHRNGIKDDDRPANLEKLANQSSHFQHHASLLAAVRQRDAQGHFI